MDNEYITQNYKQLEEELQKRIMAGGAVLPSDIPMFNPLVLAYVGDTVYENFVRTLLVSKGSMQVAKLHKKSIAFVKAKSQAEILEQIMPMLTEDEQDIVRRGRNTKSTTVPKNADLADYRYATGFEALIGFLYLTGKIDRLMEVLEKVMEMKKDTI